MTTAVPVAAANVNTAPRQSENAVIQQGYPRNDSAFVALAMAQPPAAADVAAVAIPASDAPAWDIDVKSYESTERVAHYVTRFTGPVRSYVADRLSAGTRYEPMIRDAMRAGGIPEDMYYLALVESGYDPTA
jgi:hypothetical protein